MVIRSFCQECEVLRILSNILFGVAMVLFFISLGFFEISTRRMKKALHKTADSEDTYNPKSHDKKGIMFLLLSVCFGLVSTLIAFIA